MTKLSNVLDRRLRLLANTDNPSLLLQGLRGIERETLRVDAKGRLALTAHLPSFGSALTNPIITTDYSESLLELITPAESDIVIALTELDTIHRFVYSKLEAEYLWNGSMPCRLPEESQIPIAWYGSSHTGMMKHVYRRGLALRYGRTMQCIAGIHYNYSLPEALWDLLKTWGQDAGTTTHFQSECYVALIRNFRRYSWLLIYLFGASPAASTSFLRGQPHQLAQRSKDTLYLPYATSLRMSDLGYQNKARNGLDHPFNSLAEYVNKLYQATRHSCPQYEAVGTRHNGEWIQINTNVLQIENEFYATIRPKRTCRPNERELQALCSRGVQYVEVRCIDINPFEPMGISLETSRFLDAFLLFCALEESPLSTPSECERDRENFALTAKEGRRPELRLFRNDKAIPLKSWGMELLERISLTANTLDTLRGDHAHINALELQRNRLRFPDLTPSGQTLAAMEDMGGSYETFIFHQSLAHSIHFRRRPPTHEESARFANLALHSINEQERMEREQTGHFDEFIAGYGNGRCSTCEGSHQVLCQS